MSKETDIVVLLNSKARHQLTAEAMLPSQELKLKPAFTDINRDAEIAQIIKLILPKGLKNSLLSGTVLTHIRNQLNLDTKIKMKE
jgi:hypothetical protein